MEIDRNKLAGKRLEKLTTENFRKRSKLTSRKWPGNLRKKRNRSKETQVISKEENFRKGSKSIKGTSK